MSISTCVHFFSPQNVSCFTPEVFLRTHLILSHKGISVSFQAGPPHTTISLHCKEQQTNTYHNKPARISFHFRYATWSSMPATFHKHTNKQMVKIRSYKLSFRNISPAFQGRLWTEVCQKASLSSWAEFSTQGFKAPSPRYSAARSLLLLKQMLIFLFFSFSHASPGTCWWWMCL